MTASKPHDWSRAEARARAQLDRAKRRTLSGEDFAGQAPSSWRRTGRRTTGRMS